MTLFAVPVSETATNFSCPVGPPQVTEFHSLSAADVRDVQVMPSGLVITLFPVPVSETATNSPLPQVTEFHSLSAADVRDVQVVSSA